MVDLRSKIEDSREKRSRNLGSWILDPEWLSSYGNLGFLRIPLCYISRVTRVDVYIVFGFPYYMGKPIRVMVRYSSGLPQSI